MKKEAHSAYSLEASNYEKGRPSYPEQILDLFSEKLNLLPMSRGLDCAAGTGKWTRVLFSKFKNIIALEPVDSMSKELNKILPDIKIIRTTAESTDLDSKSLDFITCAQAFHWFDVEKALLEFSRILKNKGILVLIWNNRDYGKGWLSQIHKDLDFPGFEPHVNRKEYQWKHALNWQYFEPLEEMEIDWNFKQSKQGIVEGILSISTYANLSIAEKEKLKHETLFKLNSHPMTKDHDILEFPYKTEIFWTRLKN